MTEEIKPRRRVKRLIGAGLTVLGLVLALTACSSRAPSDMIGLYYTAGSGDNQAFKECIEPGTSGSYPIDDKTYWLPTSIRGWNIQPKDGDSDQALQVGSKPGQVIGDDGKPTGATQPGPGMLAWASAQFYLNTDCQGGKDSPIVQFWNKTGNRYHIAADGDDGEGFNEDNWRKMLAQVLEPAMGKALRTGTRLYSPDDLDSNNNNVWAAVEKTSGPLMSQTLRDNVGGDYFCGPGFDRGREVTWQEYVSSGFDANGVETFTTKDVKGKCPPLRISLNDMGFADAGIAAARAKVFTAQQEAKAQVTAAQAQLQTAGILAQVSQNPNYLKLREYEVQLELAKLQLQGIQACASNSNCTNVVSASGVTVGVK